jgi:hypothetical protein
LAETPGGPRGSARVRAIDLPIASPIDPSIDRAIDLPIASPIDSSIDRAIGLPIASPIDPSIDRAIDLPIASPIGWGIDWGIPPPNDPWTGNPPFPQSSFDQKRQELDITRYGALMS